MGSTSWRSIVSRLCFIIREAEEPWELAEALDDVLARLAHRYGMAVAGQALDAAFSACPSLVERKAPLLNEAARYAVQRGFLSGRLLASILAERGLSRRTAGKRHGRRRAQRRGAARPRRGPRRGPLSRAVDVAASVASSVASLGPWMLLLLGILGLYLLDAAWGLLTGHGLLGWAAPVPETRLGDNITLSVRKSYVVISYHGARRPAVFIYSEDSDREVSFGPWPPGGSGNVLYEPPISGNYTRTRGSEAYSFGLLARAVNFVGSDAKLVVDSHECSLGMENGRVTGFYACVEVTVSEPIADRTVLDALLLGVNSSSVERASAAVLGNSPLDAADATWRLLKWLEENTVYDNTTIPLLGTYVETPLEFLQKRRGVCSDYAVFSAAVLLRYFREVYVLLLNTDRGPHAAAAVVYRGHLFVVDQVRPPVELPDYIGGVFRVTSPAIVVMRVSLQGGQPVVNLTTTDARKLVAHYPDSWPSDGINEDFARAVEAYLARLLRARQGCPLGAARMKYYFTWDTLRYYTPLMERQWARYVAEEIVRGEFPRSARCVEVHASGPRSLVILLG